MKLFHDAGWQVYGTEVSPYAAEYVRQRYGFSVHRGDVRPLALPEGTFDYIQLRHVLEHVTHDPVGLLVRVRRLLKPAGILRIDTPNMGYAASLVLLDQRLACWKRRLLNQPLGEYMRAYGNLEPPGHVLWFTRKALLVALERAGLRPLQALATYQGDPDHYPLKDTERLGLLQRFYRLVDRAAATLGRGSVLVVYARATGESMQA